MKIGIIGAGSIAGILAKTMQEMEDVTCYAVAARDAARAKQFAQTYGFEKSYGSYEELVSDPQVELVYIATPHSHHYAHMKLCLEHNKAVLCEKAFTLNKSQAEEIRRLSAEKQVFVAEALWTRYMPSRKLINDLLAEDVIGKVTMLTANLSYPMVQKERLMRPELAGGALLDVGIYAVNFALMHFGTEIDKIESSVQFTDTGVDGMETVTVFFKDGKMASLTAGLYTRSDRKGIFYGEKGYMIVENINNPQSIAIYDTEDQLIQKIRVPEQISGYEYEIRECIESIRQGRTECSSMPLSDSVFLMKQLDQIRGQWGLVYPGESDSFV